MKSHINRICFCNTILKGNTYRIAFTLLDYLGERCILFVDIISMLIMKEFVSFFLDCC